MTAGQETPALVTILNHVDQGGNNPSSNRLLPSGSEAMTTRIWSAQAAYDIIVVSSIFDEKIGRELVT